MTIGALFGSYYGPITLSTKQLCLLHGVAMRQQLTTRQLYDSTPCATTTEKRKHHAVTPAAPRSDQTKGSKPSNHIRTVHGRFNTKYRLCAS